MNYCNNNHNLDKAIDKQFEEFKVGYVKCNMCNFTSKRYISEADILLYFSCSQVIYFTLTFISYLGFYFIQQMYINFIIMFVLIICAYKLTKFISRYIYKNAPFKKELMYKSFNEDQTSVAKVLNWQFVLFFALVITTFFTDKQSIFFFSMTLLSIFLTFIKFALCIQREKKNR